MRFPLWFRRIKESSVPCDFILFLIFTRSIFNIQIFTGFLVRSNKNTLLYCSEVLERTVSFVISSFFSFPRPVSSTYKVSRVPLVRPIKTLPLLLQTWQRAQSPPWYHNFSPFTVCSFNMAYAQEFICPGREKNSFLCDSVALKVRSSFFCDLFPSHFYT